MEHAETIAGLDRAIASLKAVRDALKKGDDPFARKARFGIRVSDLLDPIRELEEQEKQFWRGQTFTVTRSVP